MMYDIIAIPHIHNSNPLAARNTHTVPILQQRNVALLGIRRMRAESWHHGVIRPLYLQLPIRIAWK